MVNLYKQFEEWVIQWNLKLKRDEFFLTRLRLGVIYTVPAVFFLTALSYVLYSSLLSQLAESTDQINLDPSVKLAILQNASEIIKNLIMLGGAAILFIVLVAGYFLTKKTLEPIQRMIRKQERFIADASHELRTPLTVMKTDIEVTLKQKDLSLSDTKTTLSSVLQEVNTLSKLSNDLLNISRERLSEIEFKEIDLSDFISSVVKRVEKQAKKKKIILDVSGKIESNVLMMGSESMVSQIFYNLISNAIQYTPKGGKVEISQNIKKNKYVVSISDTGIGVSKENLDHIFEPFYRAENARSSMGSGLGLSIVKSNVELHMGKIEVKSEVGRGTTFTVFLPIV